jgi:hypothetical protein
MIGAKTGDRVLIIGADDPDLAAAIASVTGLNGQTLVVDPRPERGAILDAAAARAGTLVEFQPGAPDADAIGRFDVAVVITSLAVRADEERRSVVTQAVRAVRAGGRVVLIDGRRSQSRFPIGLSKSAPRLDAAAALQLLSNSELRATRQLADTEGVAFYEGRK